MVWVAEEPRKAGFRYRTRPDHPEDGEESFVVDWAGDDEVSVTIASRARPQMLIMRLAGPVGRLGAALVNRRYLWAVRKIVATETGGAQPDRPEPGCRASEPERQGCAVVEDLRGDTSLRPG